MKNIRGTQGFTLIELMIVVVIIGILAAIAIPRFTGVSNSAKQSEANAILKQIYTLQEAYYQRMGSFQNSDLTQLTGYDAPTDIEYFNAPQVSGSATTEFCASMAPNAAGTGLETRAIDETRQFYSDAACSTPVAP